ncbi:MAG: N-acetylmuramoyl-L-alanine amidase [Calditrichia bacterium]|nr:N-acetylmuramoyl-L-alanine amidase [Calditrichia bacterium]
MKRRKFLLNFPVIGIILLDIKKALANLFLGILPWQAGGTGEVLTIQLEGKSPQNIPLLKKNGLIYISTLNFAKTLQCHTYFNDAKKKIVLYLPQNKVVVTANNAFVIIDDQTFQMPAPAIWQDPDILVPVKYFLPMLNRRTTLHLEYNEKNQITEIRTKDINISAVEISSRKNGTVIRFKTFKDFKEGEVTADMRYGWLHIDFYNGKIDREDIEKSRVSGLVRKINTFQFQELASIAFLLRSEPLSQEIILKPENNEVLVVLRTNEDLDEGTSDIAEEKFDTVEPSDEVKKQLEEERRKWLIDVLIIDPGHGGKDPGTVGKKKTYEKDIVLAIALKLGKIVEKEMPDLKIVYTRKTDKFVPLQKRTKIANEKNGKVFISIHANSVKNKRASGFETYILGPEKGDKAREVVLKENSVIDFEDPDSRNEYKGINHILATMAQNAFSRQSEYLASLVQTELSKQLHSLNIKNRGVKQGPFWVMVGATMPNILIETGFLSNSYDLKILKTASNQYKIAQGIFEGLKRYKQDYESTI